VITEQHLRAAVDERLTRGAGAASIKASLTALAVDESAFRVVAAAFIKMRLDDAAATREQGTALDDEDMYKGGLIDGFVLGVIAARQEAHG
jgi:hypothetical protein